MNPYPLRNGHVTSDRRLDWMPTWDHRNMKYLVRDALPAEATKPRSYTWRIDQLWDQGVEGRCVEFAICHELKARPAVVTNEKIEDILATKGIYWPAQQRDYWAGGSYPGADPHYEGTSVLHGMLVARDLGFYSEFRWATTLDDFILAVGYKGPGVIGVNWYRSMFYPDAQGFVDPTGSRLAGGHAVCVNAVNVKDEYFTVAQSWGRDHGVNGFIRIRFEHMERLLNEAGEFAIPVKRYR